MAAPEGKGWQYIGIDVGGTKIQASVISESGAIVGRKRCATPRTGGAAKVLSAIEQVTDELMTEEKIRPADLQALGIAVPGVVDPKAGKVIITPNMSLSGTEIVPRFEAQYDVPVVLGNDCNLGTLGESWLGAARGAGSVFGILVGTGIGGGIVQRNRLWAGYRNSASEIGHTVIKLGGPECACGNHGCLEALASRSAIERDIRSAVKSGRKTVLTELLDGDLSIIRSGALRQAIEKKDPLVVSVLRDASKVLGQACVSVFHMLDPEVIVLGGGVVEACGDFMMPIVRETVAGSRLPGSREGGGIYLSALGDDAVVLGAVALARMHIGRSPFKKRFAAAAEYQPVELTADGEIAVGRTAYGQDIVIRVNGNVRKRKKRHIKQLYGTTHCIGTEEVARVCKGGPEVLFVGTGKSAKKELTGEATHYLERRAIECHVMSTAEAVDSYNDSQRRKAAILEVS
jgi:glucokinase